MTIEAVEPATRKFDPLLDHVHGALDQLTDLLDHLSLEHRSARTFRTVVKKVLYPALDELVAKTPRVPPLGANWTVQEIWAPDGLARATRQLFGHFETLVTALVSHVDRAIKSLLETGTPGAVRSAGALSESRRILERLAAKLRPREPIALLEPRPQPRCRCGNECPPDRKVCSEACYLASRKAAAEKRKARQEDLRHRYKLNWPRRKPKDHSVYRKKDRVDLLRQFTDECGGRCPICQRETQLVLDHCHVTGNARSALCAACNSALGLMHENPAAIENLKAYAERCEGLRVANGGIVR